MVTLIDLLYERISPESMIFLNSISNLSIWKYDIKYTKKFYEF